MCRTCSKKYLQTRLTLYAKGGRDIQAYLNQFYGVEVSPTLIFNGANYLLPVIWEWQFQPLQRAYATLILTETRTAGEQETSKFWLTMLNELKNRGVENILICRIDNLTGCH